MRGKIGTIVTVIGALGTLLILVFGGGFVYNNWFNVPDLAYTILPTYKLQDQSFGGLVVENRGRATAHDVSIRLTDLASNIEQYSIDSDELCTLKDGGTGASHMTIWLDRMTAGSATTIYLLTLEPIELDGVAVRAEEGPGHPAVPVSAREIALSWVTGMLTVMALLATVLLFRERLQLRTEIARAEVQYISLPYDFIDHFAEAQQRGAQGSQIEPHLTATCGQRSMRAIFEHPPANANEFSTLAYHLVLPPGKGRLVLGGFIGILTERATVEGPRISRRRPENPVQFEILINEKVSFFRQKQTSEWEEFSIRVPRGEDRLSICFRTNGLGDHAWNWAAWGEPRLAKVLEIRTE